MNIFKSNSEAKRRQEDKERIDNYAKGPRHIQRKIRYFLTRRPMIVINATVLSVLFLFLTNYAVSVCVEFARNFMAMLNAISAGTALPSTYLPFFFARADIPVWASALVAALAIFFGIRGAWLIYKNMFLQDELDAKGSRRWTTLEELQEQYRAIPDRKELFDGPGGIPVSRYKDKLFIDDGPVNNMIIGSTRSGKGEIFISSIMDIYSRSRDIRDRASMIFTDPKGELCAQGTETLKKRGYKVRALDLIHFNGDSYNPLEIIKDAYIAGDTAEAEMLTKTITTVCFDDPKALEKQWIEWAKALTNALILAHVIDCCNEAEIYDDPELKEECYAKINFYSVTRMLSDMMKADKHGKFPIDDFFDNRPEDDVARLQYAAVRSAPDKTKGGIFTTAFSFLSLFTMESLAKMTATNTIDFEGIGYDEDQPTALFLLLPDYDSSNHFLATILLSQLRFILAKRASVTPGGKCVRRVVFILDEYGNLQPLPDMSKNITTDLGRGIYYNIIIQAYSQIFKQHGADDGKTIIGNCGNQIYLLTAEYATAEQFSQLIGNQTITVQNTTGDELSTGKTFSESVETKSLLHPNQLMELKEGECVIVRVAKRRDLQGNKITATPIFATGKTAMKYRYEYLYEDFDNSKSLADIHFPAKHKSLDLQRVVYKPDLLYETVSDIEDEPADDAIIPEDIEGVELQKLNNWQGIIDTYMRAINGTNGENSQRLRMQFTSFKLSDLDNYLQKKVDEGMLSAEDYCHLQDYINTGVMEYARAEQANKEQQASQSLPTPTKDNGQYSKNASKSKI